jgi:hypothetical protein
MGVVDSLSDAVLNLADQWTQMQMDQGIKSLFGMLSGGITGGPGTIAGGAAIPTGGFVPGLTGPKLFAAGGVTKTPAVFGDDGPEAAVPLPDGRRIPVDLRGAGKSGTPIVNLQIVNQGSPVEARGVSQRANGTGGIDLQAMIIAVVNKDMASGGGTLNATVQRVVAGGMMSRGSLPGQALKKGYSLKPSLTRRG